ncbi:MAG: excisionase [Microbacterium sp.]|uniref:helix-turn-helix domain-containing protein n=1 Tax=uncultured Microbacterium sp. TaxID=191216 RepID=UPI000C961529|nr:helix-turn-helix domain-containing protein [uncultured Microbacterium sp.]MAL07411.1 excisionase [Microbacterium sp.]
MTISTRDALARDWLTIGEVQLALGVSRATVNRRIADGTLVAHRFGPRLIRISAASVRAAGVPLDARHEENESAA